VTRGLRPLLVVAGATTAVCLFLGLLLLPMTADRSAFSWVRLGHLVFGLIALVAAPAALAAHLVAVRTGRRALVWVIGLMLVGTLPTAVMFVTGFSPSPSSRWRPEGLEWLARPFFWVFGPDNGSGTGLAFGVAAAVLLVAATGLFARPGPARPARTVPTGVLLTAGCAIALTTGVIAWLARNDLRFGAIAAHSLVGVCLPALLVNHALQTAGRVPSSWRRAGTGLLLLVTGAGWVALWGSEHERKAPDPSSVTSLSFAGLRGPHVDVSAATGSEGCGAAGCHEATTAEWRGSAHRFAADNELYLAVVEQLVREQGPSAAAFCAGCHDPVRALTGTVEEAYADGRPPPGEGVSCFACHATIGDTPQARNGHVEVLPPAHGHLSREDRARIRMAPREHRLDWRAETGCARCHRLEVGPFMGASVGVVLQDTTSALDEPSSPSFDSGLCVDCHMPIPDGRYLHHSAGANLDLPAYAVTSSADEGRALEQVVKATRRRLEGPDGRGVLTIVPRLERGESGLELVVVTLNDMMLHPFPAGPADLRQVWQRVRVESVEGDTLLDIGDPTSGEAIDPRAARLGGEEFGSDGQPLARHRIWDLAHYAPGRMLDPGGVVEDRHRLDGADGPVVVTVEWWMRRASPEFTRWARADGEPFSPHRVARWTGTLTAPR